MILMKIEDVDGDCLIKGFEKFVTLDSFSFGVERELADSAKSGTADINIGVGELQEVSVSKSMDRSSPYLAKKAINGSSMGKVDIKFLEATTQADKKNANVCYLHFVLDTAFVKSWSMSGDADDRPTEDIALWFNRIAFQYAMTPDGKNFQALSPFAWDHTKSKAWTSGDGMPLTQKVEIVPAE